jgi:diketogulonate reductase-like aldo/keto reductase
LQVLLRWALQRGGGVVTRSSRPAHIAQSARVFDFSLSAQEMLRLDGLAWFTSGDWNVPRGCVWVMSRFSRQY